jgi:thiol:disulfide interchange protein
MPTWPVASGSLLLGFAVAQATGVRPLGGLVLLAGAVWCALRWRPRVGTAATLGLLALAVVLFALSHVLGDAIGTWPAVVLVAAVAGAAAWWVADRPRGLRPVTAR